MQVDFYQLSRDPVDQVLPAIAARILAMGARLLVVADEAGRLERISVGLWNGPPDSFLAHGRVGEDGAGHQPILLGATCDAANGARHIALVDGLWRDEALAFDRVFHFFDDLTIDAARASWRSLAKREGIESRYFRQDGRKWLHMA